MTSLAGAFLAELDDVAQALEHEHWIAHVLQRLHQGEIEYCDTSLDRPLSELLNELSEEAADLGAWGSIAAHVLDGRTDLEDEVRALLRHAIRDAAAAGANAWARIAQAATLLNTEEQR